MNPQPILRGESEEMLPIKVICELKGNQIQITRMLDGDPIYVTSILWQNTPRKTYLALGETVYEALRPIRGGLPTEEDYPDSLKLKEAKP